MDDLDYELDRMVHLTSFAYKQNWRRTPTRDVALDRPGPALFIQAVAEILDEIKGDKFAVSYIQRVNGIDLFVASDHRVSERKLAFLKKVRDEMLVVCDKVRANRKYSRAHLRVFEFLNEDIQLYKTILWKNRFQVRHKLQKHMGLVKEFCTAYLRRENSVDVSALVKTSRLRDSLKYFSRLIAIAGALDSRDFDLAWHSDDDMELFVTASQAVPHSKEEFRVIDSLAKAMNIQGDVCHALRQSTKQVQAISSLCKLARPAKRRYLENMRFIAIDSAVLPSLRHPKPGMWDWLVQRSISPYTMCQLKRTIGFSFDFVSKADDHSKENGIYHPEMLILTHLSKIRKSNPFFKTRYAIGLNKPSCKACFEILSRIDWLEYGFERFAPQLNSNRRPRTDGKMCVHGWRLPPNVEIASEKLLDIMLSYEGYLVEGLTHVWPPGSEKGNDDHQIVAGGYATI
ncbi:hypothetical protein KEM56_002409 [Ascosphaera pollenicola]|nr:hypothetical protein KEM56_002409 [Ascosphaera pollenicola]